MLTCSEIIKLYLCCSHWWPFLSCPKKKNSINMCCPSFILMAQRLNDTIWSLITAYGDTEWFSKKLRKNLNVTSKTKFKIYVGMALIWKLPGNILSLLSESVFKDCSNWPITFARHFTLECWHWETLWPKSGQMTDMWITELPSSLASGYTIILQSCIFQKVYRCSIYRHTVWFAM